MLGSIYVAKQVTSGAFNKTTSEVATSTKNAADETKQTVQESVDKATKSDNKDQEAATKEEEQKTETAQSQTADQSDDQNADSEGASQDSAKSETPSQVPQTGVTAEPSHLPQTGPAETLMTAMKSTGGMIRRTCHCTREQHGTGTGGRVLATRWSSSEPGCADAPGWGPSPAFPFNQGSDTAMCLSFSVFLGPILIGDSPVPVPTQPLAST